MLRRRPLRRRLRLRYRRRRLMLPMPKRSLKDSPRRRARKRRLIKRNRLQILLPIDDMYLIVN
jgi:hypothetical protein